MAKIELWSTTIPGIGFFAEHHWLVIVDGEKTDRWEIWHRTNCSTDCWGYLHKNLMPVDKGMDREPGKREQEWNGNTAETLITRIENSPFTYPWLHTYQPWPGPNSNTYVQRILKDRYMLGWRAFGKRFQCD